MVKQKLDQLFLSFWSSALARVACVAKKWTYRYYETDLYLEQKELVRYRVTYSAYGQIEVKPAFSLLLELCSSPRRVRARKVDIYIFCNRPSLRTEGAIMVQIYIERVWSNRSQTSFFLLFWSSALARVWCVC